MIFLLILLVIFGLLIPGFLIIFTIYNFIADFKGAPYVATSSGEIDQVLAKADLKKGRRLLELGSGDGRVLRFAVKKYGVKGEGIELNFLLILWSRLIAKLEHIDVNFKNGNLFEVDFKNFHYIYLFLTRKAVIKLAPKITKECKKGTLLISRGFDIPGLEGRLIGKLSTTPFPTYFYKI